MLLSHSVRTKIVLNRSFLFFLIQPVSLLITIESNSSAPIPIDFSTLRIVREEYDPATWSNLGLDSEPDEDDDIELGDSELQTFDEGLIRVS